LIGAPQGMRHLGHEAVRGKRKTIASKRGHGSGLAKYCMHVQYNAGVDSSNPFQGNGANISKVGGH
jgi:hypothetical protein